MCSSDLLTGALIKRVAHARAFMTLSALVILSNAAIAVRLDLTQIGRASCRERV